MDDVKALKMHETIDYHHANYQQQPLQQEVKHEDINNNETKPTSEPVNNNHNDEENSNENSDEEANIIPWRAQLRKTNSKLNLLD